jgi:hypothetical protein
MMKKIIEFTVCVNRLQKFSGWDIFIAVSRTFYLSCYKLRGNYQFSFPQLMKNNAKSLFC